ncbi:MAG: right-handed parallel beta-helix repeat-containing protein [Chloroflexi bacterium]|nr:right-handed parallel beta-helix repeat-containing protein [Chloroflexota bacterium]
MHKKTYRYYLYRLVTLIVLLLPGVLWTGSPLGDAAGTALAEPALQATTNTISLRVVSARTEPKAFDGAGVTKGDPVTEYKFLISIDNTGDPFDPSQDCQPFLGDPLTDPNAPRNPNYPGNCEWPSIRTVPGWAPIYAQGDQTVLSETATLTLPDGKYLISVMADGYKVDGEHFTLPMEETAPGSGVAQVLVQVHPYPLPPATMVIKVFEDISMTNGQFDAPVEQGLAGFRASINDIAGEITTDLFGNPLCTEYQKDPATGEVLLDAEGNPIILSLGQGCYSDADGIITIPNIGPLRYDVLVFPPAGEQWIQTTTLEGSQGWDTWLQEAGTGLDNEFLIAAEPFPWTIFGFVRPSAVGLPSAPNTGSIKGVIMGAVTFSPTKGGLPYQGEIWGGLAGTLLHRPIANPWLALNDLQNGDTAIWVGQGNADGSFQIDNIPSGNYVLTYWDEKQHYILDFVQVTVNGGETTDVGVRTMTGWFTEVSGYVFHDLNENGKMDVGEPGIPDYLVVLKDRDNTEIDRMSISALTDASGFYELEKAYPMGSWMVLEAYSDLYRTTGVTYQTLNMPEEVTLLENIVDIGFLPILGQPARLDWGVKPYGPAETGGIAGTVFYDTVRAEDDARYAGAEPWQPGIPGLTVNLYAAVVDPVTGLPLKNVDGSYQKGPLLNTTVTEHFERPQDCQARDVDGNPMDFAVLPPGPEIPGFVPGKDCLEGPLMGTQLGHGQQPLDGNWGFTEILNDPITGDPLPAPVPIPPGKYLVEVEIPTDALGNPMFKVTCEECLNIFDGDEFEPAIPPPACAGPLHTVDVAGVGIDGYPQQILPGGIVVPPSTPFENPNFAAEGGSRFEGQPKPSCDIKYVELTNGKAVAPIFTLYTDVPIPGKWKGYIIDDLNISTNPLDLFYGEMVGTPYIPIGIYDFTGRLVHTVHSDRHGVYEVLLPSDGTFNAPSPSGMLANVYYIYGNDPGPLGSPNPNYNPQYRSIGTSFEIYPGVIVPSDLAPVQNGVSIWSPGSQQNQLARCALSETTPQLYAVSKPYATPPEEIVIYGVGFGATAGKVKIAGGSVPVLSWSDREIRIRVPKRVPRGPRLLTIATADGQEARNTITMHVLGDDYTPTVYEVGVGKPYDPSNTLLYDGMGRGPIQHAIDDAWAAGGNALVVVYPGHPVPMSNPQGWYIENPVIYSPIKLQGVGPGGTYQDGSPAVPGSVIDGRAVGGDTPYSLWWRETLIPDIWNNRGGWDRGLMVDPETPRVYEGAVITVFGEEGEFTKDFYASIDGFTIQGGDQQGFPNNIQQIGGAKIPGVQPNVVVQGGGIFVDGYGNFLQIKNNIIRSNGGAYGGGIRLGTPDVPEPLTDNHNDKIVIARNRIIANGGTNLAGGIGIFAGADKYQINDNDICGCFSAEYGGGISHYGYSHKGRIFRNRIYFNKAYDEGGGIMIAGQLPADPAELSPGAGQVWVFRNLIQSNLSNDDGGGLRFLMAGFFKFEVFNNIIVNNVSTHEGGGIAINDAPRVRIYNNTIMKNLTTATAMTSTGLPAPAGVSTSRNSDLLQATLPAGYPLFSNPVFFNNILWDNRAGTWNGDSVTGIGLAGDPSPVYHWDIGLADGSGVMSPKYCILQVPYGADPTNIVGQDPQVVQEYDTTVIIQPWRGNPNFVGANIVAVDLPIELMGDYHLTLGSPAINTGARRVENINAPGVDYDGDQRPAHGFYDIGADEVPPALLLGEGGPPDLVADPAARRWRFEIALPMLQSDAGGSLSGDVAPVQVERRR